MWWSDLFTDMDPTDFFNFSFLPKYGTAFVRGIEYSLLLAVAAPEYLVLPILCEFASLLGYHAYLKGRYLLPMSYGAAALAIVLIGALAFTAAQLRPARKKR